MSTEPTKNITKDPPSSNEISHRTISNESNDAPSISSNKEEKIPASNSWWSFTSNVVNSASAIASTVSTAVVEGVKNEIAEIREDIETVATASVSASKNIAEYSSQGIKQVTEQAKVITDASKSAGTEFMKTDLTEFKKVLNEEAVETVQDVKEISGIVGGTLSSWAGNLGK